MRQFHGFGSAFFVAAYDRVVKAYVAQKLYLIFIIFFFYKAMAI